MRVMVQSLAKTASRRKYQAAMGSMLHMQPAPMPIWVKADMAASHLDVRFTPRKRTLVRSP